MIIIIVVVVETFQLVRCRKPVRRSKVGRLVRVWNHRYPDPVVVMLLLLLWCCVVVVVKS